MIIAHYCDFPSNNVEIRDCHIKVLLAHICLSVAKKTSNLITNFDSIEIELSIINSFIDKHFIFCDICDYKFWDKAVQMSVAYILHTKSSIDTAL